MKSIYWKILEHYATARILAALVASPERYRYIKEKVQSGELSNDEATAKNINKAKKMARQLVRDLSS